MKTLWLHWRKAHITSQRGLALRDVLLAHPGEDRVVVVTSDKKMLLDVLCDAGSFEMRKQIREVTDPAITMWVSRPDTKPFGP